MGPKGQRRLGEWRHVAAKYFNVAKLEVACDQDKRPPGIEVLDLDTGRPRGLRGEQRNHNGEDMAHGEDEPPENLSQYHCPGEHKAIPRPPAVDKRSSH